jgi:hypothetical protein
MTNPFKAFRQWQKERYFRNIFFEKALPESTYIYNSYVKEYGKPPAYTPLSHGREGAIKLTREHFNDPTFIPRSKTK